MSTLKEERAVMKENKRLKKLIEHQESHIAFLRADILARATEYLDQTEITFALVDHIFDSTEENQIRTLGEAKRQWAHFKKTINESESGADALDKLGIEIEIHHRHNEQTIMDMWKSDREQHQAKLRRKNRTQTQ